VPFSINTKAHIGSYFKYLIELKDSLKATCSQEAFNSNEW